MEYIRQGADDASHTKGNHHGDVPPLHVGIALEDVVAGRYEASNAHHCNTKVVDHAHLVGEALRHVSSEEVVGGAEGHAGHAPQGKNAEDNSVYPITCKHIVKGVDSQADEDHEANDVGPDVTRLIMNHEEASEAHGGGVLASVVVVDVCIILEPIGDFFVGDEVVGVLILSESGAGRHVGRLLDTGMGSLQL